MCLSSPPVSSSRTIYILVALQSVLPLTFSSLNYSCILVHYELFSSLKCRSNLSKVPISSTHDLPVTTELSLGLGLVSSLNYSCILVHYELFSSLKCRSNLSKVPISSTHDLPVTTELSLGLGRGSSLNYSCILVHYELFSSLKCRSNLSKVPISSTHDLPVTTELSLGLGRGSSLNYSCILVHYELFSSLKCRSNLSKVPISSTHDLPVTTELSLGLGRGSSLNYSCILVHYELFSSLKCRSNLSKVPISSTHDLPRYLVPDQTKLKTLSKAERYLVPDQTNLKKFSKAKRCLFPDYTKLKTPSKAKRYLVPDSEADRTKSLRESAPIQTTNNHRLYDRLQHRSVVRQSLVRYNLEPHTHTQNPRHLRKKSQFWEFLDNHARPSLKVESEWRFWLGVSLVVFDSFMLDMASPTFPTTAAKMKMPIRNTIHVTMYSSVVWGSSGPPIVVRDLGPLGNVLPLRGSWSGSTFIVCWSVWGTLSSYVLSYSYINCTQSLNRQYGQMNLQLFDV
eukprot:sb/3463957/